MVCAGHQLWLLSLWSPQPRAQLVEGLDGRKQARAKLTSEVRGEVGEPRQWTEVGGGNQEPWVHQMPLALGICQVLRPKLSNSQLTKPDLRVKVPAGVWAELGNMAELGGAPASQACNCHAGGQGGSWGGTGAGRGGHSLVSCSLAWEGALSRGRRK